MQRNCFVANLWNRSWPGERSYCWASSLRLPRRSPSSGFRRRQPRRRGKATPKPISSRSGRPSRASSPPSTSSAATVSSKARRCSSRTTRPTAPRSTRPRGWRSRPRISSPICRDPGKPTEIAQAEANLDDAIAARGKVHADLQRNQALLKSGAATAQLVDQEKADLASADAKIAAAEAALQAGSGAARPPGGDRGADFGGRGRRRGAGAGALAARPALGRLAGRRNRRRRAGAAGRDARRRARRSSRCCRRRTSSSVSSCPSRRWRTSIPATRWR